MLDFRVETFLCVCRYMNYTKAAEELRITQPGVSQHIHCLEEYYGVRLFQYSGRTLSLTPAGEALLSAMLSVKHDMVHLKNRMAELAAGEMPILLGATLTIGEFYIPRRLARYIKDNPSATVDMTIGNTKSLLKQLDEGTLDFVMLEGYFPKREYESRLISRENFIAVCSKDDDVSGIECFSDLFSRRLVAREPGSGTRDVLEHYMAEQGYSISDFSSVLEINNIHALKQLVESGLGISFLYELSVRAELSHGLLKKVEIPDWDVSHEFRFVWRKDSIYQDYYEKMFEKFCQPNDKIE